MIQRLDVYRLKTRHPEKVNYWLDSFHKFLEKLRKERGLPEVQVSANYHDPTHAPWSGAPFILIGDIEQISVYLNGLSRESKRIIDDCAYYWIVAETDDQSDLRFLQEDRCVVLSYNQENFYAIADQICELYRYQNLAGLSKGMARVRAEIVRIASRPAGPGTPAMILGESGVGKEEASSALYTEWLAYFTSGKKIEGMEKVKDKFLRFSCGSFTKENVQSQLLGVGQFTGVKPRPGILEGYSDGCVQLDEFDTALHLQGPLLRILSTPWNRPAQIYRIGEEYRTDVVVKRQSWVWLVFSTNAKIQNLLEKGELREDFIFRFEDRIIYIPPLRERPADIPAIAYNIWDRTWEHMWSADKCLKRPLSIPVLQWLFSQQQEWEGNVRALRTLLSLTASMVKLPTRNAVPLRRIMEQILKRGSNYRYWVGIIASPVFNVVNDVEPPQGNSIVQAVRELDVDYPCFGRVKLLDYSNNDLPFSPSWPVTGSERKAESRLTDLGKRLFKNKLREGTHRRKGTRQEDFKQFTLTRKRTDVRTSVRLSRIICYLTARKDQQLAMEVDKHISHALSGKHNKKPSGTASGDLKLLEDAGILRKKSGSGSTLSVYIPCEGILVET